MNLLLIFVEVRRHFVRAKMIKYAKYSLIIHRPHVTEIASLMTIRIMHRMTKNMYMYIYIYVFRHPELPLIVTLKKVYDRNAVNKKSLYLLLGVIIFYLIDYIYTYIYIYIYIYINACTHTYALARKPPVQK